MKILFVTPPPYLPNRLHRIRSFDLIRALAKKHEVHLLAVTSEEKIPPEFIEIRKLCKTVTIVRINKTLAYLNCLKYFYLPLEVAYCYSLEVNKKLKSLINKYNIDLVYLKRLRSAVYFTVGTPAVIDTTDAMSLFYHRLKHQGVFIKKALYYFEEIKYRFYEKNIAKRINNWIVCSKVDQKYLANLGINSLVVPNMVDTNYYRLVNGSPSLPRLIFRGLMDKPVNISAINYFVKSIWPKIIKIFPHIELHILGPNPTAQIRKLSDKNIIVTGYVPDLREYFRPGDISICPVLVGTGTRHKILQSWAMGIPVVSTFVGAEGLNIDNNLEIADSPGSFANKIIRLIKNKKRYLLLAKNGRKTVEKNYSIKAVAQQLEEVLNYVVKNNSRF